MSLKARNVKVNSLDNASKGSIESAPINLSKKESEFLLLTIKNALFKGEYVEVLYNLTLKIQEHYKKFE